MTEPHRPVDPSRGITLVWASLLAGVVAFGGVAWALATGLLTGEPFPASLAPSLVRPLLLVPVALMGVGVVLRRSGVARPEGTDPVEAYRTRILLVSALQEGGGFLGIVLSLLAGLPRWILLMAALSVVSMILSRPLRREIEDL